MATRKRPSKGDRSVEAFPLDTSLTKPQRIAAFLDWWATHHPYDFAGYHEITRAVEGYKKLPRIDTEEVQTMKDVVGRCGNILHDKFKRALVRQRGIGARASVDSLDAIQNKAVARARNVERGIVALHKLDDIIDVKSIPDTPENRPLKNWYQRDVKGILKLVASPEFLAKMLPPASDDDKDKGKPNGGG